MSDDVDSNGTDGGYGKSREDVHYRTHDDDGTLVINGVHPNDNGNYCRAGFDTQGRPIDSYGNSFCPHWGSLDEIDGRCNAPLNKWRIRYGKPKYCLQYPKSGSEYCSKHSGRENIDMRAQELFKHGLYSQSLKKVYERVEPSKQALMWALFDDLLDESIFNFESDYREIEIDCDGTSAEKQFPVNDENVLKVEVPQPTEYLDRSQSLFFAAIDGIKLMNIQESILTEGIEVEETTHADLDSSENFVELKQLSEHHLNLPYSRLARDRSEFLEYGGVGVDEASDDMPDQVVEIYDSPTDTADEAFTVDAVADMH